MSDILSLNLSLTRKRFKVYGFFNIASLLFAITAILMGIKYIQYLIGDYEESSIFLLLFTVVSFMPLVFPKNYEENCIRQKTFFVDLNMSAIQSYFSRINIVLYQCFITYLLLPFNTEDISTFSVLMLIHSLTVFVSIVLKSKMSATAFGGFYSGIKILITVLIFIHIRSPFTIMTYISYSDRITALILAVTGILFLVSLMWIKPKGFACDAQVMFLSLTSKLPFIRSNSDLLMFIRKNLFFNALTTIALSNIAFRAVVTDKAGSLITFLMSLLIAYFTIFSDFMNDEKGKIIFFYNYQSGKKIINRKAKNTILSSLVLFPFTFMLCAFFVPIDVMLTGYLLSIIIFSVTIKIIPFNAKRNNFIPLYTIKQMIALMFILIMLSITFVSFLFI